MPVRAREGGPVADAFDARTRLCVASSVVSDADNNESPPPSALAAIGQSVEAATTRAEVAAACRRLVGYLTSDVVIAVSGPQGSTPADEERFRIVELELYVTHSNVHDDPFTHADVLQREPGLWYFHRKGGTFKGGSFKGMDITFGTQAAPCGALVRSIARVAEGDGESTSPQEVVDGPCLVVDRLLKARGVPDIKTLVADPSGRIAVDSPRLRLVADNRARLPHKGLLAVAPRVGLIPRRDEHIAWAGRLLRFVTVDVASKMKHRGGLVAGAQAVYRLRCGRDGAVASPVLAAGIKSLLGTRTDVDSSWTDCPVGRSSTSKEESTDASSTGGPLGEAEAKELLGSAKLNTAPGALALVRALLRREPPSLDELPDPRSAA